MLLLCEDRKGAQLTGRLRGAPPKGAFQISSRWESWRGSSYPSSREGRRGSCQPLGCPLRSFSGASLWALQSQHPQPPGAEVGGGGAFLKGQVPARSPALSIFWRVDDRGHQSGRQDDRAISAVSILPCTAGQGELDATTIQQQRDPGTGRPAGQAGGT